MLAGEMNVLYLFMRYRFNWDEVQFSMFCTYSIITNLVGKYIVYRCTSVRCLQLCLGELLDVIKIAVYLRFR